MDKNELRELLRVTEQKAEAARAKRAIKTILVVAVAIFLFIYVFKKPSGIDIIGYFLFAVFLSVINLLINSPIFFQLFSMSERENRRIEELKKQISEAEGIIE